MTAKEPKFDANTEAFQMRAQWLKAENCRLQWQDKWSWLLDDRKETIKQSDAIRREAAAAMPRVVLKQEITKSLKPVPLTSTGFVGWLAAKRDCQLEIYTSWLTKIPRRAPDVWEKKDYVPPADLAFKTGH